MSTDDRYEEGRKVGFNEGYESARAFFTRRDRQRLDEINTLQVALEQAREAARNGGAA